MFEEINSDFIQGTTYYLVYNDDGALTNIGDGLFERYTDYSKTAGWFYITPKGIMWVTFANYIIYRYVSKEEYYAKLKEKYDVTCLNIVLKRLVDDMFKW